MEANPTTQAIANVNGQIMPLSEAKVSVLDRGFLFGDAIYEVFRVYQGKIWLLEEHFARMEYSLQEIRIEGVDLKRLRERILTTTKDSGFQEAIVYVQITRGAAPRKHPFPAEAVPLELFYVEEFEDPYAEARGAGAKAITFPDLRWQRCDIKSTNLLGNVLAMQAAKEAGGIEALLVKQDETVTEGTHTSLFGVEDDHLLTTPQSNAILPGITRGLILKCAEEQSVPVKEEIFHKDKLLSLPELFITGTTTEVLPLVQVDGMKIGRGVPGLITQKLQESYREMVRRFA